MGFGWLDGCGSVSSRPSSCIRRASRYRASPAEPRRIDSILRCSSACFWDGCAASRVTAKWWRSPRSRKKTPGVPSRERESMVGERTRIINRMKAALVRLGISGFKPGLLTAPQKLDASGLQRRRQFRPTCWMRCDATWPDWLRSASRSTPSSRLGWSAWNRRSTGRHAMTALARVIGVGVETADMLVQEALSRNLRDRRAVARYAGLTGSPDESGSKRREQGLSRRATRGCVAVSFNWRGASCAFRRTAPWRSRTRPNRRCCWEA